MIARTLMRAACLATVAAASLAVAGSARAQQPPPIDNQIQNGRPKFLVRAWVDRPYRIYGEGEAITLKVRCEEDALLYVLYQQADGKMFQIFPNSGQPDNRIKGMQDVQVPGLDDAFRWVVGPPFGNEIIKVIASRKPVDVLSLPGLKEDHFNPVSMEQIQAAGKQLAREAPSVWSEHDVDIQTVRKGVPTVPPEARKRYGVFFGVSKYEFSDVMKQQTQKPLNLKVAHKDAQDTSEAFRRMGRLDDARLFLDGNATREQMRQSITEWLPSVSKPGDTVFIYFAGHGTAVVDDDRDEKDGFDEVLMATDTFGLSVMSGLLEQRKAGTLSPAWEALVTRLMPEVASVYQQAHQSAGGDAAGPASEKTASAAASAFLLRTTGVGDDEMGHWLQKLDGRRVVVITDACLSGGLTPTDAPDKGLDGRRGSRPRVPAFDFLRSSLVRLKDLNQPSLTVLAAASEKESSVELPGASNGMFTTCLLKLMQTSPGPVDAMQALETSRREIAIGIKEVNEIVDRLNMTRPEKEQIKRYDLFVPQLFTNDAEPVYLKPPA